MVTKVKPGAKPRGNPNPPREYQFKKGNAGRPKGSKTKPSIMLMKLTEAQRMEMAKRHGITPLDFLMSILRDPNATLDDKIDAAKAAAPYMHRKQPIGIDNGQGGPIGFYTIGDLSALTDEELVTMKSALQKLGTPMPVPLAGAAVVAETIAKEAAGS